MFENREEAGRLLAVEIEKRIKEREAEFPRDFIVAAILRGGIVLGKIIADYFKIPLEPLVIRKIGAPHEKELAIGALGPKETIYWDKDLLDRLKINESYKTAAVKEKSYELKKLENIIMGERKVLDFTDKKVIVVDDGVATGSTVLCAQIFLRHEKAKSIILATPVIAKDTFNTVNKYFDKVIAFKIAPNFYAVGQFYKDFPQVEDEEVVALMSS
jgi:predicted phosphoribosyltransferase